MTASGSVEVWNIGPAEVPTLVQAMFDPRRRHSLTVVSPASDVRAPRIDVDKLVSLVADLPTDVVVLADTDTTNRLSDSVADTFHCYGGSVRVVMPGARITDHFRRHPLLLIYPEDDPQESLRRIVAAVERTPAPTDDTPSTATPSAAPTPVVPRLPAYPVPKPGPRPTPPKPATPALPRTPDADPTPSPPTADSAAPAPAGSPVPAHTTFGLADIEAVVARAVARTLEEQLGGPSDDLARERSRADTAEEHLAAAQERIRRLEAQTRTIVRTPDRWPQVYADREQQLRWEVETTWLTTVPEPERGELRAWTLDDGLLDGLELHVVPRGKTIEVMIAILRGEWQDRFGGHQVKESEGGPSKVSPDGTPVWRTYIKEKTPQAPRLTWWHTRNGGVHFDHVGGHDDLL